MTNPHEVGQRLATLCVKASGNCNAKGSSNASKHKLREHANGPTPMNGIKCSLTDS